MQRIMRHFPLRRVAAASCKCRLHDIFRVHTNAIRTNDRWMAVLAWPRPRTCFAVVFFIMHHRLPFRRRLSPTASEIRWVHLFDALVIAPKMAGKRERQPNSLVFALVQIRWVR